MADTKRIAVTIRNLPGTEPDCAHEVDVTSKVGTSSYDRVLDGLYRRVDLDRYFVDSSDADREHERRRTVVRS